VNDDRPRLYSIPPGEPFVDVLAEQLLVETGGDPLRLAEYTVLLPTRRACRAMGEAFLRVADGRALLLPTLRPIGDVDETAMALGEGPGLENLALPPAIPTLERELTLTRLILAWSRHFEHALPEQAALLARELARLLDQLQTEDIAFDALRHLVPAEHADHWRNTIEFLNILSVRWPEFLAERGALDPAERRNLLLKAQAERWTADPPEMPVIAAGSTGSLPATRALLKVVAGLPQGRVVLPGLDRHLDGQAWLAVGEEPTHPQFGLWSLLSHLGADREDVAEWPVSRRAGAERELRAGLIAEVMRPAATSEAWRDADTPDAMMLAGLSRCTFPTQVEEAAAIACMMRAALEDRNPAGTAALVTADRSLARRVASELERWDVAVDDSAGQPLSETGPAVFLRHCLGAVTAGLAPVSLLSLLKHPLAAGGRDVGAFRAEVRRLEHVALRGPRPAPGTAGLTAAVAAAGTGRGAADERTVARLTGFVSEIGTLLRPLIELTDAGPVGLPALVDALVETAERLAASAEESGAARLWTGDAGEALSAFLVDLRDHGGGLPPLEPGEIPGLFDALLAGQVVRPRYGAHPRLFIWGVLEARLLDADLLILGGLNEGSWPPEPAADPWLSRPMRGELGLPSPERQIGLSAHDFMLAACGRKVVLTRSEKVGGQPAVPARWLSRLNAVLRIREGDRHPVLDDGRWATLAKAMTDAGPPRPVEAPAPKPPLEARPDRLSVTRIETWMRDPYSIYAQRILKLEPLDDLEADPGAADRGIFVHDALDRFLKDHPRGLPVDAIDHLLACGRRAFGDALAQPVVKAFWWPRFERVAHWFVQQQRALAEETDRSFTEVSGDLVIEGPAGPFRLTGTADRIDLLRPGAYVVIDYKTGQAPSQKDLTAGVAPQLPLEAAMVQDGAWEEASIAGAVGSLQFWRLPGGSPPGKIEARDKDLEDVIARARAGLADLVARFQDPDTPYLSIPRPKYKPRYNDYEHLARIREWFVLEEGGE